MYRKSLLPPGLYRIYPEPPGRGRAAPPPDAPSKMRAPAADIGLARPGAIDKASARIRGKTTNAFGCRLRIYWAVSLALLFSAPVMADVADTLQALKPGVVGVGVFRPSGSPRGNLQGTGFAVLDGRYVVSCAHIFAKALDSEKKETHAIFIGRDRQMTVRGARVIATDQARDLALLKIEGEPLPALKLGDSDRVREGWQLYFTGYPIGSVLGLNPSTHRAGLAAIIPIFTPVAAAWQLNARTLRQAKEPYEVFELDAVAYPGNSGSPVWHPETGEVLGVVNSVYVKGAKEAALSAPSGISYAIPAKYVQRLLTQAAPRTR